MIRKRYPSDLTNAQWTLVRPVLPAAHAKGRPRTGDLREVVNGILSVNAEGCRWLSLPHDLPH